MNVIKLKNELSQRYPYRIELHAHTKPASVCSEISPKELVDTYKALGYHGMVVTNHFVYQYDSMSKEEYLDFYLQDFEETEKCGEEQGMKVYLGAEIRFTDSCNDYLVFGVDRNLLSEIYDLLPFGIENFRKQLKMPDSVFVQAHPMRNGCEPVDPSLLDGVEVYNMHPGHNSRVGLAALYTGKKENLIVTAGSDYHHPKKNHEGLAAIRTTHLPNDSFELAGLLRNKNYLLEIAGNHFIIP